MRPFRQFEVGFCVLNKAIHLNRRFGVRLFLPKKKDQLRKFSLGRKSEAVKFMNK